MKRKNIKCGLVYLLCAALMFESTGVTTLAEEAQAVAVEEQVVSDNVATEDAIEVLSGTGDATDSIASGTYYGMNWNISGDGLLTISGEYDETTEGTSWSAYKNEFESVKVTATGVKSTARWFSSAGILQNVDFSEFDTSQVTDMRSMFSGCVNLTSLDLSNFDMCNVENASLMLSNCAKLETIATPKNLTLEVPLVGAYADANGTKYGALPKNMTESIVLQKDESILALGNYRGMDWVIDSEGALTISGAYDESASGTSWGYYSWDVKSVKVTATGVTNTSWWFSEMENLERVDFSEFDSSQVTDMSGMFDNCHKLNDFDIDELDTKNVTDMSNMFVCCHGLTDFDLSSFDTSNVIYMTEMFAHCDYLTSVDLSSFNTGKVVSMMSMFEGCDKLVGLDLSNFDTSQVTNMANMFYDCNSLASLDISKFDTANVEDMSNMFRGCYKLTYLDVSGFDTGTVTIMSNMFRDCRSLTVLDVRNFVTDKVTSMGGMFCNCDTLTSLNLSSFDMSIVESANRMLLGCGNLKIINAPKNVTVDVEFYSTFVDEAGTEYTCLPKEQTVSILLEKAGDVLAQGNYYGMDWVVNRDGVLTISGVQGDEETLDVLGMSWTYYEECITSVEAKATEVKETSGWFKDMSNLRNVDFSELDTSQVWSMSSMFSNCTGLTSLDLSSFETTQVEDMSRVFYNCSSLTDLNLSGFDTSKTKVMELMFRGCSNLTSVDLSSFDTSQVEDMYRMFYNCSSLTSLDMSSFDLSSLGIADSMLTGCTSLVTIKTPLNLPLGVDLPDVFVDSEGNEYTQLPRNMSESITLTCKKSSLGTNDGDDEAVVASGNYCEGVTWTLTDKGVLTIAGTAADNVEVYTRGWSDYAQDILSANVKIRGVKDLGYLLSRCENLETVDFTGTDTRNAVRMEGMFLNCTNLKSLDLHNFDTSQVTNMACMFEGCKELSNLELGSFDTGRVTDMGCMFDNCSSLTSLDVSGFDTSQVTDMYALFEGCESLTNLDVSSFNTSKVATMKEMFAFCSGLTSLDVSKFDTSQVTDMSRMFDRCENIATLNLSGFNTSQVTNMNYMFYYCRCLTSLDLSGIDMTKSTGENGDIRIANSRALAEIKTPKNVSVDIALAQTMYDENGKEYTSLPIGMTESITLTVNKPATDTNDGEDTDTNDGDDAGLIRVLTIAPIPDQTYTGKALKPEVTVTYGRDILTLGKDYTVSYKNNTKAAKADSDKAPVAIVKGKGNFEGTVTIAFNILAKELTESNTEISEMLSYENGKAQTVKPTVKLNGKKMAVGKDYTIEYPDKTEGAYKTPGIYNVIIKGTNNYQGSIVTTMTILSENQVMASKLKVGKIAAYDYKENEPATPTPKVTYKNEELELGKDYAITYLNNDRAGKATLIITGLKNTDAEGTYVAGTLKKTFTIKGTALKKTQIDYEKKVTYTGAELCPKVTLTLNGTDLTPGKDYTVEYTKNVNVGKATIILKGQGGFTGTVKKTFTIQADDSVADKLAVSFVGGKAEAAYSAKGAKPEIKIMLGNSELKLGKDYSVSYKNNKKLAEANATKAPAITIKGKGNYKFNKSVTFSIVQKNLEDADISIVSADKFVGSKKGYLSAPVVKDANGKKLKVNKDYTIVGYTVDGKEFDGTGEVAAGTVVTVTVQGKNNYTGTDTTTYRLANNDISKTKVNKPKLEYNGGKVVFTEEMLKEGKLEITDKATGKKLVYGTDFIVTGYKSNTKKGTATVIIQGIGEYGGTKNVKFSIVSKKMEKK